MRLTCGVFEVAAPLLRRGVESAGYGIRGGQPGIT